MFVGACSWNIEESFNALYRPAGFYQQAASYVSSFSHIPAYLEFWQ